MSKITTPRLPEATEEYSREQVSQLVQTLEQVIFILNNTYVPETLRQDDERISWFLSQMANVYTNYKVDLTTTNETTVYTVPAETTAIVKSIRVSNDDASNACTLTMTLTDSSSNAFSLEKDKSIAAKTSAELLTSTLVAKESEVFKATAQNANDLHIIISVLQITNTQEIAVKKMMKKKSKKLVRRGDDKPVKKMMGGGMMYKDGGTTKKKMKKKKLAAMYGDPNKITRGDIITAAKMKKKKGKK